MSVHLREVTAATRAELEALAVDPAQARFVDGVADSIVEAAETPDAAPRYWGVYEGDTPVGFVMISDGITVDNPDYLGPYFLWRLLVDHRHQGRGHGAATVALVVEHLVETRPDARVLLTSCGRGDGDPYGFYLRQGFRDTGRTHDGETVLELDLPPLAWEATEIEAAADIRAFHAPGSAPLPDGAAPPTAAKLSAADDARW